MGTWSSLAPAVLSLVGVGLGAGGTLAGQHLNTRANDRRLRLEQASALRAERKEAILHFLGCVLRLNQAAGVPGWRLPSAENHPARATDQMIYDLWLAQRAVDLVCSEPVRGAGHRLAAHTTRIAHDGIPTDDDDVAYVNTAEIEFADAVHAEFTAATGR